MILAKVRKKKHRKERKQENHLQCQAHPHTAAVIPQAVILRVVAAAPAAIPTQVRPQAIQIKTIEGSNLKKNELSRGWRKKTTTFCFCLKMKFYFRL